MGELRARALLDRIAARDRDALAELQRLFYPRLRAFLVALTLPPDLVEDIIVDSLIEVWLRRSEVPADCSIATWLAGIAHRHGLRAVRDGKPAHPGVPEAGLGPARQTLPPVRRALLALVYGFGCSREEAGRILACPPASVVKRMQRVRRALRRRKHLTAAQVPQP
jgi:DNA-directed RNA polymerase specialized sigma24 family protein